MLKETFDELVDVVVEGCRSVYGDRLEGVVVYGSVARRAMRHDSDLDLLVVAEPLIAGRMPRMDEFGAVDHLAAPFLERIRTDGIWTRLSPLVHTEAELDDLGFLIFDIACDGVVAYDEHGSVAGYLQTVRQRLDRRGAERRVLRGSRYWVLDPNVRPGQVVRL